MKFNPKNLESYDYALDSRLIAQTPIAPKSAAKLLVYNRANNSITHTTFAHLWDFVPKTALIVLNDSKVIKARIFGKKPSGAKLELLYHNTFGDLGDSRFLAQIRGRVKVGDWIIFSGGVCAKVCELRENGLRVVEFYRNESLWNSRKSHKSLCDLRESLRDSQKLDFPALMAFLETFGHIPLPPYIKRDDLAQDSRYYQSIFAKNLGSIAAPTASLHLDTHDLDEISRRPHCFISLHIGAGTFFGVESRDITAHKMHSERVFIPRDSANAIMDASEILCVGTTATRCVEFLARNIQKTSKNGDFFGACDIFLHPLNPPIKTSHILTNFHLPKSTLIMLVAGFIGIEKTREIYTIAKEMRYRFYSYGDGMLIL